jgi:hypothetical protein
MTGFQCTRLERVNCKQQHCQRLREGILPLPGTLVVGRLAEERKIVTNKLSKIEQYVYLDLQVYPAGLSQGQCIALLLCDH